MVNQAQIRIRERSFPTRAAAERSMQMEFEFVLNQPGEKGEPSIAEIYWTTGDVEQALADLPPVMPPKARCELKRLLQPWPEGRYVEAYRRSGGILNLFTPVWGEKQDETWLAMMAEWEARSFSDARARQAALAELVDQWNQTPHPFFAGLTPAQVMVGGGPREARLSNEFLDQFHRQFKDRAFEGEGDGLVKVLLTLRGWQVQPRRDGRAPQEIIQSERNALLALRTRALAQ